MDMVLAEVTEKIRALLKSHPEGLSITSISSLAGVNRNTLAKYLEILQNQGSAGMRQVGAAKVYYPANRVPVSAVRRFCRNYIIVDHVLDLVETSVSIPACVGMPAGERTSRRICDQLPNLQGITDLEARLRSALRDEEQTARWATGKHRDGRVFSVSFVPTVLESGRPAVSLVLKDVTEKDRNGDGDELAALRTQALFEDQNEYIVRLSPEGDVRWTNPGYCRLMDRSEQDLIGRRFRPPVTGEERERWNLQLRRLTAEHPVTMTEFRTSAGNGVSLWQRWTLRALYASSGTLLEYLLVGRDIGEHMVVRNELLQCKEEIERLALARKADFQESKLRYYEDIARRERVESRAWFARFAVENSADGICWIDGPGRILCANRALCRNLGYTRDDLRSLYFPDIDARCDRESLERMWTKLRHEGRYRTRSMTRKIDGTLLPTEISMNYLELNGREYCCVFLRFIPGPGKTEKTPRENSELFRKAFEESPLGSVLYDREIAQVCSNKAFAELAGTIPAKTGEIDPLRYPALIREHIGALQRGLPVRCSRSFGQEGDPGIMHLKTTIMPLCDPKTTLPEGYLVLVKNDDGRGEDGTAAGSPIRLLDEILRNFPDAAFAVDRTGNVSAWNRAMEKLTGIQAAGMLGKGNREYSLPFYRERVPMLIDRVIWSETASEDGYVYYTRKEGNCLIAERAISLPDGYSRVIQGKAFPVRADTGRIVGAIEFIYDITALRRTEESLMRERAFNTAVLDAVEAPVVVADDNGRIVWCNERCKTLTGYAAHKLIGWGVRELFGIGPGTDGEQPLSGPRSVKEGKRTPTRWSYRTFTQPGTGRFEIYTGVCPGRVTDDGKKKSF